MTTLVVVPRYKRFKGPKKDALSFVRNYEGNPASAASRAFTAGIARRIETLAELGGIGISELEEESGLAKGSIWRVLSGSRGGRTSIELVARVAIAIGDVDIGFLITGEFQPRDAPYALRRRKAPQVEAKHGRELPSAQTSFPGMVEYLNPQATAVRVKKRAAPKKKAAKKTGNPEGAIVEDSAIRLSNDFGARVAILCELHDLSLSQLEDACGLSRGSLNSIVSGRRAGRLSAWIALVVADALRVDVGFLLTGRPHDPDLLRFNAHDDWSWPARLPALARRFDPSKRKAAAPKTRKKKPLR